MSFSKKKKLKNSKRNKNPRTEKNLLHRLFGGFGRPNIMKIKYSDSDNSKIKAEKARMAADRKEFREQKMNVKLAAQATTKPSEATRLAAIATRLDAIATEKTLEANRLADLATSKQEKANRLAALVTKRLEAEQLAAQAKAEQLAAQAKAEQLAAQAEAQRLAAANSTPLKYQYQVSIDRGPDRKIQVQITRSSDNLNKTDRESNIDAASLEKKLTEAVAATMRDKSKDPIQFLSDQFASFAAKNRATQNWAKARATQKLANRTAKKTDSERAAAARATQRRSTRGLSDRKTVANRTQKVWSPEAENWIRDLMQTARITPIGTAAQRREKERKKRSTLSGAINEEDEEDEQPIEVKLGGRATKRRKDEKTKRLILSKF